MSFNIPSQLVKLSAQTASSSASISFTSVITSDFTSYYVTLRDIVSGTNNEDLYVTYSTNNGTSYLSSNYKYAVFYVNSDGTTGFINSNSDSKIILTPTLSSTTSQSFSGNLNLFAFNQNVSYAMLMGNGVSWNNSSSKSNTIMNVGCNTGTTAVNAIQFTMASGNIASGVFTLYGIPDP